MLLFVVSGAAEYKLVKLETSLTVILPPTVSVLYCNDTPVRVYGNNFFVVFHHIFESQESQKRFLTTKANLKTQGFVN